MGSPWYHNPIVTGILGGVGKGMENIAQQREDAADRALRQRALDETRDFRNRSLELEARKGRTVVNSYLANILKAGGYEVPEGENVDTSVLLPMLKDAGDRARDLDVSRRVNEAYEATRGRPATPGMPAVGSNDEPENFVPGTPGTPARPFQRDEYRARVAGIPGLTAGQAALAQDIGKRDVPKLHNLSEWGAVNPETGEYLSPPASARRPKANVTKWETAEGTYVQLHDEYGEPMGEPRLLPGGPPPREPRQPVQPNATAQVRDAIERFQQLRRDPQFGPRHPATREAHEMVLGLLPTVTPAEGGVTSRGSFLSLEPYPSVDAPAPAPAPSAQDQARPGVIPPQPRPPDASERKDLADLDAGIITANNLVLAANQNRAVLGGLVSNPIGALRRLAGPYSATALTQDERKFLANFGLQVAQLRRDLVGLTQTDRELKALVETLPNAGNVDESTIAQLESIRDHLLTKRRARGNVLRESNRRDPAGPARASGMSGADARAAAKYLR